MKINEAGFVDYVTSLINETIDAISVAHLEQEQKILDIKNDLLLSDKLLIEKYDLKNAIDFSEETSEDEENQLLKSAVENHRELLENYFQKGVVKTFVNAGKLSTKFVFSFSDDSSDKETTDNVAPSKMANLKKMRTINRVLKDRVLKANRIKANPNFKTKLTVSPISKTNSENNSSTTNITSYLELEFRTVVDK